MSKKAHLYHKLSKMKKADIIALIKQNNLVIDTGNKKDDLVNHLFYYMSKRTNSSNYTLPKIHTVQPLNGQIYHEKGLRPTMEDTHLCAKIDDAYLIAVFDGHGGNEASDHLPSLICKYLLEPLRDVNLRYNPNKMVEHIKRIFRLIDDELINIIEDESGSTASMILDVGDTLYSINLGDSRNIIYKYITNSHSYSG